MSLHVIERQENPTVAPMARNIHWTNTLTGETFYSVGTSSVNDWRQAGGLQSGDNISSLTNDSNYQNAAQVSQAIQNLVNMAPGALDTLAEIASAIGDDPDFSATITNLINNAQQAINNHEQRVDNPHSVTSAQVGLGNVDNTSDLSKVISILTQAALDLKADASSVYTIPQIDAQQLLQDNAISANASAITTEGEERTADVSNLQSQISANNTSASSIASDLLTEITNRTTADTNLQNQISTNDTDLANLLTNLSQEIANRISSDNSLQASILQRVTKPSSSDNSLTRFDGTQGEIQESDVYVDDSGRLGIGTPTPQRELHINDGNLRVDRSSNSVSFFLVRKDANGDILKTFRIDNDASGLDDGIFSIKDNGSSASGSATDRFTILNDGTIRVNNSNIDQLAIPTQGDHAVNKIYADTMIKKNALYLGSGGSLVIGSSSNASNQSFQIPLSNFGYRVGETARIGAIRGRGDFSGANELLDIGFGSATSPKTTNFDVVSSDDAIFRTSFSSTGEVVTVVDLGGGVPGVEIFVSPSLGVNFSPVGMPNGFFWQIVIDILIN